MITVLFYEQEGQNKPKNYNLGAQIVITIGFISTNAFVGYAVKDLWRKEYSLQYDISPVIVAVFV